MSQLTKIEIQVEAATAEALADATRRDAVGRLIDRIVRPVSGHDPLAALLEDTAQRAGAAGLTDDDIDAELAADKAERRAERRLA